MAFKEDAFEHDLFNLHDALNRMKSHRSQIPLAKDRIEYDSCIRVASAEIKRMYALWKVKEISPHLGRSIGS